MENGKQARRADLFKIDNARERFDLIFDKLYKSQR